MATANPLESDTSAVRVKLPPRRYQSKKPQIKDKLTIYFQNSHVSGGCEVEDVNVLQEDDSGLWMTVTFTEPFGVTRVLEKHGHELFIDGIVTPIEVHAHFLHGGHSSLSPETFRQFHGNDEQVFAIGETEEDEEELMVAVTGFKPSTSEELLKLYFENPRRSGGGDIKTWEKDPKTGNTIRFSFEDQSVARSVTSRAHRVDDTLLSVVLTVKKPPRPVKKHGLFLNGIPDGCTTDYLSLFIESRSGLENPTIQYGEMPGTAICTFSEEIPDLDKVIQRICSKKLQGVSLNAERVYETDCIFVEGFSSGTSLDLIELYFENKKKSGGGEVREVEQGPADDQAVVYFEDWKVVGDVLSRAKLHIIGKQKLSVEEYHSNLGRLGQGNAPTRHMPKSFSIEVEENKMVFIFKKGTDMKTKLFEELRRANCVLHWPDGDIKTSARIEPFVEDRQRRSSWSNWSEVAVAILQRLLGRCVSQRIAVPQQVWEDVINKVRQLDSRCYTVEENAQQHIVQLVGEQQAVETGVTQINGIIYKEIKGQAEHDTEQIKIEVVLLSIQFQQLTCCGIKEKLEHDFPDIGITTSTKGDQTYIVLEGTRKLVQDAELSMRRQMDQLKDTTIDPGAAKLLFIKNISDKLHNKLQSKGILVAFTTVGEDRIVIYGPRDADLNLAKEYIGRKIEEDVIPVKTPEAVRSLQSDQGIQLLRKINERDFVTADIAKTKDGIAIAGFKSELKEAKDEIMMFLKTNTVTKDCIRMSKSKEESIIKTYGGEFDKFVKENEHHHVKILPSSGWTAGFSIEGNQEGLEKARQFINSLVSKTEEEQSLSSDKADSPGQEAGHDKGVIHHKHSLDKTSNCSRQSQSECLAEEVLRLFLSSKEFLHLTDTSKELKAGSASDVDHTVERPMQRVDGSAVNDETLKEIYPQRYDYKNGVENPSDEPEISVDCPEERQDVRDTSTLDKPGTKLWSAVSYEDEASGKADDGHHTVQDNSVIVDMYIYKFIETFEKESLQKIMRYSKVKIKPVSDGAGENEKTFTFTPKSKADGNVAEAKEKFITLYQTVSNGVSKKPIDCSSATKDQVKEATIRILSDFKADTVVCKVDGSSNNRLILRRGDVDEVARKFREYAGIRSGKSLRSRAPDVQKTLAPKTDVPKSVGSYYQNTPSRQGLEERQDVSDTSTLDKPIMKLWSPVPYKDEASGKVADNHHTVQDNSVIVDMHIYEFIETFEKESLQKIQKDHKVKIKLVSDRAEKNEKMVTFTPSILKSKDGDVAEAKENFISLYQKVSNDVSRKMIDCSSATKDQIKEATKKILGDFKADTVVCKVDGSFNNRLILRRGDVDEVARKFREYAGIRSGKSLRSRASDVQKTLAPKTDVPQSVGSYYQNTPSRQGLEQADGSFSFVTNEGISIVVRQGDITKQSVQALVSPTDTHLTSNGGVAKAVFTAAGRELDRHCQGTFVNVSWLRQPLQITKCIVTPGFKLSCLIIHACGPVWDRYSSSRYKCQLYDTLINCFHAAEESKFQTLAIPLVGSGGSSAPKDVCADVLVNAVVDYSFNSRGNAFLKEVLLVNIDRESTEAIKKSLHSVKATAAASYNIPKTPSTTSGGNMRQEHPLSDIPDKVKQPHQGQERSVWAQRQYQGSGRNDPCFAALGKFRENPGIRSGKSLRSRVPDVQKTFASKTNVSQSGGSYYQNTPSRQGLEEADGSFSFVTNEEISIVVPQAHGMFDKMSEEHQAQVEAIEKKNNVEIKIDRQAVEKVMHVQGCVLDVKNARIKIRQLFTQMQKEETEAQHREHLAKQVQWRYSTPNGMEPYEPNVNGLIEDAHAKKCPSVRLDLEDETITVDFQTMQELSKYSTLVVQRVDLLKAAVFEAPINWDPMPGNRHFAVATLNPGTQEYTNVQTQFDSTMAGSYTQINEIQRVQNQDLMMQYQARKTAMEARLARTNVEMPLFHGTDEQTCDQINKFGFNRSYCGKNAIAFGNGTYFAAKADYSSQNRYARPNASGIKHIYLTKVLVGDYIRGNHRIIAPPVKPSNPDQLYDSMVDNVNTPSIYVIFYDAQAYPEYLIKFQ